MQVVTKLIADLAVSTAKIANLAVTTAKIDNLAVDSTKLADLSVSTAKIIADAVTGAKIRLANTEWLRARNAADSADLNLIRANATDQTEIDGQVVFVNVLAPQSAAAPLVGNDLCNKTYVDSQVGSGFNMESRTVTSDEATAKQLTLAAAPAVPTETMVSFGGVVQFYGDDFVVVGTTLDWSGLGMDTIGVVAGDKLVIAY